jgi:iron(III) transport system substrate-binding protein
MQRIQYFFKMIIFMGLLGGISLYSQINQGYSQVTQELNIYSSRHYETDEALYSDFTKLTGIKINRLDGGEDLLIERIRNEGRNSPADILITADAGRLWRADQLNLLAPVKSKFLENRIPEHLRHPDGHWFGFSSRARVIIYNTQSVKAGELKSYQDLANPKWKGRICMRASGNIYNLSLLGSIIAHEGEEAAEQWAKGVKENFAREPVGGDTDQMKAVAAGECAITVANTYYYMRLVRSDKSEDKKIVQNIGVVFPNQDGYGTHVNISGAAMLRYAPHPETAVKFLEYLASDSAQRYFAEGNNEYPVVSTVQVMPTLAALTSKFKIDPLNVAVFAEKQPTAQRIFDSVGWR